MEMNTTGNCYILAFKVLDVLQLAGVLFEF